MFPLRSIGLILAAGVYAAAARQSIPNLYDTCEVTVDRRRYDLCPLFHDRGQARVVEVRAELSPITHLHYELSFGGPLNMRSGDDAEPQVRTGKLTTLRERKWADSRSSALRAHGFV